MSEFDLIDRIRRRALQRDDVILGIGDDAAILQVPAGQHLVVATDTLNIGVHLPEDTAPADIGWKALAVNLSDLAAMGARPAWCTLSLSLPRSDPAWLDGFLDGFLELAAQHRVALIGGDTTRGPLSVCVTVHGFVEPGRALRRDGAKVGDDIWVSGTLGDAAAALRLLLPLSPAHPFGAPPGEGEGAAKGQGNDTLGDRPDLAPSPQSLTRGEKGFTKLRQRLDRPTPRIESGASLVGIAHSAIDVSDGLLADLGHICRASDVAAELQLDALPISPALQAASFSIEQRRALQASGGDDYELCFTASPSARDAIAGIAEQTGAPLTRIGRVVAGQGVQVFDAAGAVWLPARTGYVHFSN